MLPNQALALDRSAVEESIRRKDEDGHLHVRLTPISKANVCGYFGREIPDWQELGLDGDRIYQLYRDPEELEKAVASFNGKPLLFGHNPISADAHDHERTVGSVTSPVWEAPYIKAALDIWSGPAIKAIESGDQKELSSGYRYRADMTPGTTPDGVRFDGVMRDIIANHVALVPEGRAGKDVVVGDSALRKLEDIFSMPKQTLAGAAAFGALMTFLRPKMAADAKIDLTPILADLTKKNFSAKKPVVIDGLKKALAGKLAQDADLEGIADVLEAVAPLLQEEMDETVVAADDEDADLKAALKAKGYSDEEIAKICSKVNSAPAVDEDDPEKKEMADKLKAMDAKLREATKGMVTTDAMDASIKAAVDAARKNEREISEALREVAKSRVGELHGAFDSAPDVYKAAAKQLGANVDDVHPSAFKVIWETVSKSTVRPEASATIVAQDAAAKKDYETRFPHANRLKH